jgi:hypothetical protein
VLVLGSVSVSVVAGVVSLEAFFVSAWNQST